MEPKQGYMEKINKTLEGFGGSMGTMENYLEPKPLTVQTKLQPIEPRVDNIQRGNSGAPGLWNEITGRYNPQYPRPRLTQSILQKQPIQQFAEYLKSIGLGSIGGGMMPQRQPIQGPIQNQNYLYGGNSSNPLINNYPIQQNVGVPTPSYYPSQPQSGIAYLIRRLLGYQI